MSTWPGRIARIAGGAGVLAVAAGVGAVAWFAPVPGDVAVEPVEVPVPPAPVSLVCPAPVVLPEGLPDGDPEFDPAPVDAETGLRMATSAGAEAQAGAIGAYRLGTEAGPFLAVADPAGGRAAVADLAPDAVVVGTAQPVGGRTARIGATLGSVVERGDMRGLAAVGCQQPSSDWWLVGGGTELETTTVLSVQNPGLTPTDVLVEVWGPSGPVDLVGAGHYVVAPGGERSLRLDALAPDQRSLVVRVSAAGGQVTAYLQVSELRGFTPGGMDFVAPAPAPATRQVLAGLAVHDSEVGDEDVATLRLLAPGATVGEGLAPGGDPTADGADDHGGGPVEAEVTFYGPDGPTTLPGADVVSLVHGEVLDLPLGGLEAGEYAVVVESESPVLVGGAVTRVGDPGELDPARPVERAFPPVVQPGAGGVVALVAGAEAHVVLVGVPAGDRPGREPVGIAAGTLHAVDADGQVVASYEVEVPAGSTVVLPVAELGDGVVALDLVPGQLDDQVLAAGSALAWAVVLTEAAADGEFVSAVAPALRHAALTHVEVWHAERLTMP